MRRLSNSLVMFFFTSSFGDDISNANERQESPFVVRKARTGFILCSAFFLQFLLLHCMGSKLGAEQWQG